MPTFEIQIPYIPDLSKNKMKGFRRGGGYYTVQAYKDAVEGLATLVATKSKGIEWKKDKIWVEIFLQKARRNSDVANFCDGCCDAIKQGIGIDDSWFAIKMDWEYNKDIKPYMVITIFQE